MESTVTPSLYVSVVVRALLGAGLAAGLVACGGAQEPKPAPPPAEPPPPATEDQSIDLDPQPLQGMQWQPEGLGRPGMLLVEAPKKLTVDKQRATYKKAKPDQREAEGQLLVTLLYEASKAEKDATKSKALIEEARTVLRDLRAGAKGTAQLVTLRMLAVLELVNGDYAAAAELYQEALTRFAEGEHVVPTRTWLAYSQLRLGQNAEALATVAGLTPSVEQPELSYVIAWAKWRAGDGPGAAEAIAAAARGWKAPGFKQAIDRDTWILLARGGAAVEDAIKVVVDANQNLRDATWEGLFKLHSAFVAAGRFADGVVILDKAAERVGDKIPPQDLAKFRLLQADYTLRASLAPDRVVAFQKQALATYATCAAKCTAKEHEEAASRTRNLATFFDTIYRTTRDEHFYGPATELYGLYLELPGRTDTAEVKKFLDDMKLVKAAPQQDVGRHDAGFIGTLAKVREVEVQSCYEAVIAGDAKAAGALTVTLEIAANGEVQGVATDPAAGEAGLAKVAACAAAKIKAWQFPARTKPGTTRVKIPYQLAPFAKT